VNERERERENKTYSKIVLRVLHIKEIVVCVGNCRFQTQGISNYMIEVNLNIVH